MEWVLYGALIGALIVCTLVGGVFIYAVADWMRRGSH
jgi:hypothetical protein